MIVETYPKWYVLLSCVTQESNFLFLSSQNHHTHLLNLESADAGDSAEISYNLTKFRTLKELILEAKENVNNPSKSRNHKKHPDLPKKPLTAYLRFFKEMRPQYLQKHPKMSNQELTKAPSEAYRKLPEQLKLKYSQDFQKEK